MNKSNLLLLTLIIIFLSALSASAQERTSSQRPTGQGGNRGNYEKIGKLSGRIIDTQSGQVMEYCNIALFKSKDSSLVDGGITDEKGQFKLEKLPFGRFFVKIHFIGYPTKIIDSVFLTPKNPVYELGTIRMKPSTKTLEGVEITGQRAVAEYNLDKKVVNVEQNIALQGGTAVDVMQTIPAVQVDIDGNVSMRGSSNITILIDGRPSNLTSLDELPASMIQRVELITNPSARYDPDGTTGIINIVLKKQKNAGINGMVQLNAGTNDRYSGSLSLNYRKNKVNIFGNYDARKFTHDGTSNGSRSSVIRDTASYLDQDGTSNSSNMFHNIRTGLDYFINDKNTLSFNAGVNIRTSENKNFQSNLSRNYLYDTTQFFTSNSLSENDGNGFELGSNYKRTFDKQGRELTADFFYSYSDGSNDNDVLQEYYGNRNNFIQRTLSDGFRNTLTAQTDYVEKVGSGRIETGYKFSWNRSDQDYRYLTSNIIDDFILDPNRSNRFVYDEYLNSLYFIYSGIIGQSWTYQAGLRGELANTKSDQRTQDSIYNNNYFSLFPTVHIKYEPWQNHSFQLSFSRRVNRPGSSALNPFINYADPINLSAGNPTLNPEYVNSVELGYSGQLTRTTNINGSIFARLTEDVVSRVMEVYDDGTSFTTYKNQDKQKAYGAELIVTQQLISWWRLNANFSYFRTRFEGPDIASESQENDSWTVKANSMMNIPKIFDLQINFNYDAPVVFTPGIGGFRSMMMGGTQGKRDATWRMDIGVKRDILKGKGTISLRISDLFKSQKYNITSWGENFTSVSNRTRQGQMVFLGFSYRFNDFKRRLQRQNEEMSEFE